MAKFDKKQSGLTIIELLVAMAISLIIILAAAYMYLASRESQRAIDRASGSKETGAFVMQMLGREIMNAGFYPATSPPVAGEASQQLMYETYPPLPTAPVPALTDWTNGANWPPESFKTGIYGCDGGKFKVDDSTCDTDDPAAPDTIVINFFTSDSLSMGKITGGRKDCTGADVAPKEAGKGDPSNEERKKNTPTEVGTVKTATDDKYPPQLPVFVSNRYTLSPAKISIDKQDINTQSLTCSGNGSSPHGKANAAAYQPIISGLEDLQFTYGVYADESSYTPSRYYTATEVNALPKLTVKGLDYSGWQRVSAVRVCLTSRTLGGNTRIADKAGSPRKYVDCNDVEKNQPVGDTITRSVQVFGLRNNLKSFY